MNIQCSAEEIAA